MVPIIISVAHLLVMEVISPSRFLKAAKLLYFELVVGLFNHLLFIVEKALIFGQFLINSVGFL